MRDLLAALVARRWRDRYTGRRPSRRAAAIAEIIRLDAELRGREARDA